MAKTEEIKKEEKEQSVEELQKTIKDLQNKHDEDLKKIRGFTVMLQGISFKLKELGIDLSVIGRNTDQMLDGIINDKLPDKISNQMGMS